VTELADPTAEIDDDAVVSELAPTPFDGTTYAVETTGLTKRYGILSAVDDLALKIPRGSIYGLIGPNGAGKSTTFSMIATLLRPTTGSLRVLGHDPVRAPRDVRRRLGYMPDVLGVYDNLRVDEYLQFFAASYRVPRKEWPSLVDGLLELVDLHVKSTSLVNSLSRGMKQRLSLARTLVHDPDLLVLDEPASGLDPRARVELRDTLRQLNQLGKTIIVSSHILAELEEMCTEIAIMEAGKLLASGTPRQIMDTLGHAKSISVRFTDGTSETFTVADDDEQVALLRRLARDEERGVLEFREEHFGLEELFMSITEGIVQ
jgi:ABC-2 type transport system ATP-binding protein